MAAPGRFRRWVMRPLIWALAALALLVGLGRLFLDSELARSRARDLLRARLGEALDRPVEIARVDFALIPFGFVVEGLEIPSNRPGEPPFARVRRLEVEGALEGFRRSELVATAVIIDGLDLDLRFRPDGSDNLPRPHRRGGERSELRLRIDGLVVRDARVAVAEQRARVDVSARAVDVRLAGLGGTDLAGRVAAQEIDLVLPRAQPLRLALAAKAKLLRDRVVIETARVTGPDLAALVAGEIHFAPRTRVDLAGRVDGAGALVDRLGYLHGEIAGPARFDGSFQWRREAWGFRGGLTSPGLDLFGFRLEAIEGQVAGEERAIRVDLARGRFAGGEVHGAFAVELDHERYPARLELGVAGAALDRVLDRFAVPIRGLEGEVSGPFRYDFELTDAGQGEGDGDFEILPPAAPGPGVAATGSARVRLAAGRVELPAIEVATAGQRVAASVGYDLATAAGEVVLEIQSEDLAELGRLLPFAEPGALWLPTAGTGLVTGRIAIERAGVLADLELACAGVEAPGYRATRLTGTVTTSQRAIESLALELELPGGKLAVAGRIPLAETGPGAAPETGLDLRLEALGWPVEAARPWLPFALPLEGPTTGTIRLGGSLAQPTGTVAATIAPARLAGLPLDRVELELELGPERLEDRRAVAAAAAGAVEATGQVGRADGALALSVRSPALALDAEPLAAYSGGRLAGSVRLDARLAGTLERPEIELAAELSALALLGTPLDPGQAGRLSARWAEDRVALDLDLPGLGRLRGGGDATAAGRAALDLELASDRLDRLAALASGVAVEGVTGTLAGRVRLELAPETPLHLALEVPELSFRADGRELRSLEPVRIELDGDRLAVRSIYLGAAGGELPGDELFLSGTVALGESPRLDLRLQASIAAAWLEPWLGGIDLGGRVDALAVVRGTASDPEINGQAALTGGRLIPPQLPHTVEDARALVLFYPRAVVLDQLAADFAGGELRATGRVELPRSGAPSYRFEATARRVAVRWPAGWLLRGDGELTLASAEEGRQIRGELRLDRVFYLQDVALSPAQLLQRLLTRARVEVGETDDLLSTTYLAVGVRAPKALRVRNNLARLAGGGDLTLRGTLARPVLFGEIAVEPGGTVDYAGNTYSLDRALVTFANPQRIEPSLDVVARTRIDQYDVTVRLGGTLERLDASFASDPPLPDLDVLALLSTGALGELERSAAPAAVEGGSTSLAAETLLYGQAASLLTARFNRLFGFDKLRIDPLTTGDAVSSARVTVGKRISRQLYVTYSVDPASTAQQILQVEWRLTDRLVLVLTQSGGESYAVDARWESRF